MKLLALFLTLSFVTVLFAEPVRKVGEGEPMPQGGFKTFTDLRTWANSSSWGGGHAEELTLSGRKVYYSDRMFTSGRPTAELIFYAQGKEGRILPFIVVPMQRKEFQVEVKAGEIVIRTYDPRERKWSIALRFTPLLLPAE